MKNDHKAMIAKLSKDERSALKKYKYRYDAADFSEDWDACEQTCAVFKSNQKQASNKERLEALFAMQTVYLRCIVEPRYLQDFRKVAGPVRNLTLIPKILAATWAVTNDQKGKKASRLGRAVRIFVALKWLGRGADGPVKTGLLVFKGKDGLRGFIQRNKKLVSNRVTSSSRNITFPRATKVEWSEDRLKDWRQLIDSQAKKIRIILVKRVGGYTVKSAAVKP